MRHIAIAAVLAGISGCSIPEKQFVERQAPLACLGQSPPMISKDPVVISGTLFDPSTSTAVPSAVVEAFQVGVPTVIFRETSDAAGRFTHSQGTAKVPRKFYAHTAPNGFVSTYVHDRIAATQDIDFSLQMFTPQELATLAGAAQVTIKSDMTAFIVTVVDCNGTPMMGATITIDPQDSASTRIIYFANGLPNPNVHTTDAATGAAIAFNVPLGNITVGATLDGTILRSHTIGAEAGAGEAGAIIETEVQP